MVVLVCVFFAGLFAASLPLSAVYLFLITIASTYYGLKYPNYFYFLFAINCAVVLALSIPPNLHENIIRVVSILCVTIIITLLQLFFVKNFARRRTRTLAIKSLRFLRMVSSDVFMCFLKPEYAENIYLFERRLHLSKKRYMQSIDQLRHIEQTYTIDVFAAKIDALFDILMDCAQLRRRVSDHTVFSICTKEMQILANEINSLLSELIVCVKRKRSMIHPSSRAREASVAIRGLLRRFAPRNDDSAAMTIDTQLFAEKIELFENIYNNILRVTAREPLAFLLFIAGLKAFKVEIDRCVVIASSRSERGDP